MVMRQFLLGDHKKKVPLYTDKVFQIYFKLGGAEIFLMCWMGAPAAIIYET